MEGQKIVAFLSNKLTLRGTEIALFDYADNNEKILGNKSIIITRDYEKIKNDRDVDFQAYRKFQKRFPLFYYENQSNIDEIVLEQCVTHLYIIKSGEHDGLFSHHCKNIIHCVFNTKFPHGDVYTAISQTVNDIHTTNYPVIPHIVHLPDSIENIRLEHQIPENAIVFGRYGGMDSFDIPFVHETIKRLLQNRTDIYFLFMNTYVFYEHPNIIYLPGNTEMTYKRIFINSCDALIHARMQGETFGLTCGEFAICEKPVITYGNSCEKEHLSVLKKHAIIYNNESELYTILNGFTKEKYDMKNNGYMLYTPEYVMNIFNQIGLST